MDDREPKAGDDSPDERVSANGGGGGERLRHRAKKAFGWIAGAKLFSRLIGMVRVVVLARLLAPQDFGAFGIALLTTATLERFTRPGMATAILQRKEEVERYLDPVWSFMVLRGWLLAAALFMSRGLVAGFFEEPEAAPLIAVAALATGIGGFASMGLTLLQRELQLGRRFWPLAAANVADLVVAIPAAFLMRDAMALAYGMVARNVVLVVASYWAHPHRPRFTLRWGVLRDLKLFALHGAYQSWIYFVVENGDDAFIGKVLGTEVLGIYLLVYRVANVLTQELGRIFAEVTVPVFSRVQDDVERLTAGLREALGGTGAVVIPLAAYLALVAEPVLALFLGPQWLSGIPAFRFLLVFGLFRALSQSLEALLTARGRMRALTLIIAAQLGVAAVFGIPLGFRYGMEGVAVGIALSQLSSFGLSLATVRVGLKRPALRLLGALRGPLVGSAAASAVLGGLLTAVDSASQPDWVVIAWSSGVFLVVYVAAMLPWFRRDTPMLMEGLPLLGDGRR